MKRSRSMVAALLMGLVLVGAACSGGGDGENTDQTPSPAPNTFAAEIPSVDVVAGEAEQVQIGIYASQGDAGVKFLAFGEVQVQFLSLGEEGTDDWRPGPETVATYLPAPGTALEGDGPALEDPNIARGVYVADDVTFDRPGIWTAEITATVDGEPMTIRASAVQIGTKHLFPAPGDRAIASENLTMDSKGVPAAAIDSRALNGDPVPDPQLHRATIAGAIQAGHPALVLLSTPAFCVSRFCGPDTDAVAELARRYGDRAEFIHIEIWKNFDKKVANDAANEWLNRNGTIIEPWLYLIDADGKITDRWGPLFDPDEVGQALQALPKMGN